MAAIFRDKRLPGPLEALKKPAGSDERAMALEKTALDWFDKWKWYTRESSECRAFYNGAHYGYFDDKKFLWQGDTLDDEDRVRITVPCIKPAVDAAVAIATADASIFKAAAGQSGVAAAAAAETAKAYLDETWRQHQLDNLFRDTFKDAFETGTDFMLVDWNKNAGPLALLGYKPAAVPPTMPEGVDAQTGDLVPPTDAGQPQPVYGPQGELRYKRLLSDQVAFDPTSKMPGGQDGMGICLQWDESRATLIELAISLGKPELADYFKECDEQTGRPMREADTERGESRGYSNSRERGDSLRVIVFYLRSRTWQQRPRGDCLMVVAGKMLYEGENDIYPTAEEIANGELWPLENWPVFTFLGDTRKDCPVGRSRILDAIPLQIGINGAYSKWIQHTALIANVAVVLPTSMTWEPSDEPGQVARATMKDYQITGGRPVQFTDPPVMHQQYQPLIESLRERLEFAIGINAASGGQPADPQQSGRSIMALQQRDDSRIAPLVRSHKNTWARVQTYALRLFRRNATGKRLLRVVGQDQSVAVKFFAVADLAAGTEVYAVDDTSVPRDPAKRILFFQQLSTTLASLPNEEQQTLMLELARVPEISEWLHRRSPHQMKAIENNRLLLLGEGDSTMIDPQLFAAAGVQPPPPGCPIPAPWDNAMIHKAELERFTCSREYLDRVAAEKSDPQNAGQMNPQTMQPMAATSPLEQRATWLWTYWTAKVNQIAAANAPQPIVKLQGDMTPQEVAKSLGDQPAAPGPGNAAGPQKPPMAKAA